MNKVSLCGHFIESAQGSIFVLVRRPLPQSRACILVVPPFAEEMNKARRMVTEATLALAERGIASVVPDVYGTGDSGGEFADADWATWSADLARTASWSAEQGLPITGVLGIRLGAALAAAACSAGHIPPVAATVLWQPLFDGKRWLTQFLRLRIAAALSDDRKESMQELLDRLRAGGTVEVAGYELPGKLALAIDALAAPQMLPSQLGAITWMEVIREAGAALSAAATQMEERSRALPTPVRTQTLVGDPFWGATEIVRNDDVTAATVAAFEQSLTTRAA